MAGQIIDVPGQGQVEFPEGMSDADIVAAIQKMSAPSKKAEFGMKDFLTGPDILATQASGAVASPVAGLAGILGSVLPGEAGQGARYTRAVGDALTYQPRTELGKGAAKVLNVPFSLLHKVAVKAGEKAQDKLGFEPAGATAVQTLVESLPAIAGGSVVSKGAEIGKDVGRRVMQSAVKPYVGDLRSGKAARAIETMLEEGYSPTRGSVEKMRAAIDDLNTEISQAIANSPATVNKAEVLRSLRPQLNKFKNQVNPSADVAAIRAAADEFFNHPDLQGTNVIPVQKAQELKQGTYRVLGEKAYGELKSAQTEAQKTLARGLKEEIAKSVPEVAPLNARESALLNAARIAETRALMHGNKNLGGLAWLAKEPAAAIGFLADRSAPTMALGARGIYSLSDMLQAAGNDPLIKAGVLEMILAKQAQQQQK